MDISAIFLSVMGFVFNPFSFALIVLGTVLGLVIGTIPGLSAAVGLTLLLPITYVLPAKEAIGMMCALFVGAMSGGAVSSILLGIPGTPAAVFTCFDGYPMSRKGHAAEAIGWATVSSAFGSLFAWFVLVLVCIPISRVALLFSAAEYAALALLGLTIIASLASKDIIKGLLMGTFGFLITCIGIDRVNGDYRFTYGIPDLFGGINMVPVMLGIFMVPQILDLCYKTNRAKQVNVDFGYFMPSFKKMWGKRLPALVSAIIGTIVGIIPGAGQNIAQALAYEQCRRMSGSPETFGKGNIDGIIASEVTNNAVACGALVPLLTLGIPGDGGTSIILGGFILHGIQPGVRLFTEQFDLVLGIFTSIMIATMLMTAVQAFGIKFFVKLLSLPIHYLAAALIIIMGVGTFTVHNNFFDFVLAIIFGALGYFLTKADYPLVPLILGLVLGSLFETEMRTALRVARNDWTVFFTRPISCGIIILAVLFLTYSIVRPYIQRRKMA